MAKSNFDKFIHKEVKGAKKKEQIKQEKKAVKKEREAFFIEKKREQRAAKKLQNDDRPSYSKKSPANNSYKPAEKNFSKAKETRPPGEGKKLYPKKSSHKTDEKPFKAPIKKAFKQDSDKPWDVKPARKFEERRENPKNKFAKESFPKKPEGRPFKKEEGFDRKRQETASLKQPQKVQVSKPSPVKPADLMPLNKFIAHGGICSRRDAGELVKAGKVKVNGEVILDPGFKVGVNDKVIANGKNVIPQKNLVYILLNKPKDFITTVDDPQGRKTVLDIVKSATEERIYPVGRLDRNTSGVLLLTNDGEMAQQLTHPSFEVRKIYEVKLDKPLIKADFDKLVNGVKLEDGEVHADSLAYGDAKDKSVVGIEIHSGKNRVVRRMFEHLGYQVKNLDRVMFANLTKKNVERGKWRFLSDKEVRLLKFFNKSKHK